MSTEIPIWVNGKIRWLSGIDKKTTCKDVVEVLLDGEGVDKSEVKDYTIMERWRKVERPLDENSKILKIWSHWGNEKREVRLCLRRIDNEVDSGRGSPIGSGNTPSLRRKRNRSRGNGKPPWTHTETLHPRRLAELGRISKKDRDDYSQLLRKGKQAEENDCGDRLKDSYLYESQLYHYEDINAMLSNTENVNCNRKKSGHKSYHCSGTGRLHSTLLSEYSNSDNYPKRSKCCSKRESKQKVRNSENIEKLMKLILAQGATIQSQLQKLREREEQIESIEHERHRARIEKNGRNYLLETYLGSLKDAEIPGEIDEEKGNDSGVHTEGGSDQTHLAVKQENEENEPVGAGICDDAQVLPGHRREHSVTQSLPFPKNTRSRSESRILQYQPEVNLKRTLSDNALAENEGVVISGSDVKKDDDVEPEVKPNAKEESEEVIQLRRIQSQIEMWEKVFKINKKLEKEEENLVRLHIKIKKVQSENFRIAKECSEANVNNMEQNATVSSGEQDTEISVKTNDFPEQCTLDQDCLEVHKNLEILRSDLEQNSKEIYQNFTRLIEDDKLVEQKRNCLTKLISDLERTDQEHEMLNEMITMTEGRQSDHDQSKYFCYNSDSEEPGSGRDCQGVGNSEKNVEIRVPECNPVANGMPNTMESMSLSSNFILPQDDANQSTDVAQEDLQQMKPKIVKISFEDQIRNFESCKRGDEKLPKGPMAVASGALKGILKNRKFGCDSNLEKYNSIKEPQQNLPQVNELHNDELDYQKNSNGGNCVQMKYPYSSDLPDRINNLGHAYPYNQMPNNLTRNNFRQLPPIKPTDDLKTACSVKSPYSSESSRTPANVLPHNGMVQTKVMVHNDTDSSTSSDTSGLSSMYSSSPTVEEHYVDHGYVLNTLV